MKKSILLGLAGMMFVSTAAHAISVTGQAGEHYTNLGVGFGTESSGLAVTGNWMHSDNDGDAAGVGLGLNIPLGPFLASSEHRSRLSLSEPRREGRQQRQHDCRRSVSRRQRQLLIPPTARTFPAPYSCLLRLRLAL